MRLYLLAALLCAFALPARAESRPIALDGRIAMAWLPPAAGPRRSSCFSSALAAAAAQAEFLTDGLAQAGYVVLAVNHADAACGGGEAGLFDAPVVPFDDAEKWTDAVYQDRARASVTY